MALSTVNIFTNAARGSDARAALELANAGLLYSLSRALAAGGAAIATTATQVKTVNSLPYSIVGRQFTKGATDNLWTLAGAVVPVNSFQKYMLLLDTAGAATVQEGVPSGVSAAKVAWTNVSGFSVFAPFISVLGDTKACVAMVTVATDATHTFTPGTTALNAAGITATIIDGVDYTLLLPLIGNERGSVFGFGG